MILKSKPAGDLFRYLEGPRGMSGKHRIHEKLRGDRELATAILKAQAPPCMMKVDRRRRWVRHCQGHLTHIFTGFSESLEKVESVLPTVIKMTEFLVLAGLPRDCLAFVWYEHPQSVGAHAHAGLVQTLLPGGGPYDPDLSGDLQFRLARLLSYQRGLSDPLDPDRARLIRPGPFSASAPQNQPLIKSVVDAVLDDQPVKLMSHDDFAKLLTGLDLKIAVKPYVGRRQFHRRKSSPNTREVHTYPYTLGLQRIAEPKGRIVYFHGAVCNPRFCREDWEKQLNDRKEEFKNLVRSPKGYYDVFLIWLKSRIQRQQDKYPYFKGKEVVDEGAFAGLGDEPMGGSEGSSDLRLPGGECRPLAGDPAAAVTAPADGSLPQLALPGQIYELDQQLSARVDPLRYCPAETYPFVDDYFPSCYYEPAILPEAPPEPGPDQAPLPNETNPRYFLPLPHGTWKPRIPEGIVAPSAEPPKAQGPGLPIETPARPGICGGPREGVFPETATGRPSQEGPASDLNHTPADDLGAPPAPHLPGGAQEAGRTAAAPEEKIVPTAGSAELGSPLADLEKGDVSVGQRVTQPAEHQKPTTADPAKAIEVQRSAQPSAPAAATQAEQGPSIATGQSQPPVESKPAKEKTGGQDLHIPQDAVALADANHARQQEANLKLAKLRAKRDRAIKLANSARSRMEQRTKPECQTPSEKIVSLGETPGRTGPKAQPGSGPKTIQQA